MEHAREDNLDGIDFVPVEVEEPVTQPVPASSKIDVSKSDVTIRLYTTTPAERIIEIAQGLAT